MKRFVVVNIADAIYWTGRAVQPMVKTPYFMHTSLSQRFWRWLRFGLQNLSNRVLSWND